MRRRVKITGIGPVTAAGIGRAAFERGINEPVSRNRAITRFDAVAGDFTAAEIKEFELANYVAGVNSKRMPRQTQFGIAASFLALEDAGLSVADLGGRNPLIVFGSAMMDPDLMQRTVSGVEKRGPRAALPSTVLDASTAAVGGRLAALLKTPCRTITLQSACSAGLDAIGHGAEMIASGQAEIALCGGTDAPIFYHPMIEFGMAGLSPRNAANPTEMGRPFDLWRNTGVIGEGACTVVLESEESPRPAYGWIEGYAYGNDGQAGLTAPGSGLLATMRMALANARRRSVDIDLINAWGPGHSVIDRAEVIALQSIFGDQLPRIPAVSIKGAIGNPLAAAGPIQIACVALSFKTGVIQPTVNWTSPDPECPLNLGREARDIGFNQALVNAHGITGTNSTLILSRR